MRIGNTILKQLIRTPANRRGFTLVELIIVVAVIGILTSVGTSVAGTAKQKAYLGVAKQDLSEIVSSLTLYFNDNNFYPADVDRDVPPGLEVYLKNGRWPKAPWPGSCFDWDNWIIDGKPVYQMSIRFCQLGDTAGTTCHFPALPWARYFDYYSAVYYCIRGACRAHASAPSSPGYCVNC